MAEWLFLAVLIYYFAGGAMFLIAFLLSFALCFFLVKQWVRFVVEHQAPENFPRGVPFPLWVHAVFGILTVVPGWLLAGLIMGWLE